jgi:hypothetical protein
MFLYTLIFKFLDSKLEYHQENEIIFSFLMMVCWSKQVASKLDKIFLCLNENVYVCVCVHARACMHACIIVFQFYNSWCLVQNKKFN